MRKRIVTGEFTLPVMALLTLPVWALPDFTDWSLWAGLALTGFTAYLIMELNNRNSLLRIRSRMMSTTFLFLMLICPQLHHLQQGLVSMLLLVLSYHTLFASYQQRRPEGYVFHTFLFLGIGSLYFPPLLLLAIGVYFCLLFPLRGLTWRTFMAGLFGLSLPYWVYAAHAIWHNRLDTAFTYLSPWLTLQLPDYSRLPLPRLVSAAVLVFFSIPAFVHFFHTAYNDKIRTRMLFYCITTQQVLLTAALIGLPQHMADIMPLFVVNTALLMAHYYALGRARWFPWWFNISLLALMGLGIYNYWTC